MVDIHASLLVTGDSFSPAAVEAATGVAFTEKKERGELGDTGRFRGKPEPFGSATLTHRLELHRADPEAFRTLKNVIRSCVERGGECRLYIAVTYDTQCNLEFGADVLTGLAELGVPVLMSCIMDEDLAARG